MTDHSSVTRSKGNALSKATTMSSGGKVDSIASNHQKSPHTATREGASKPKTKSLVCTKSIENLKLEKYLIYNKMTMTQERIIEALDELRLSLLEIQMSDGLYEKSKRQKNALDFCVRFSRNFLYPLKVMIDRVCQMSPDTFNSASSNDACHFVAAIYTLIYQSLRKYQRQLRYFLLEQVPQKLSALIEMIYTVTATCLEKGLFDRQDAIVDCIQERCSMFTCFIQEMQEERFLKARDDFRKLSTKQRKPEEPHAHLALKMCLNGMNMYEPKVELKQKPVRPKRVQTKWKQLSQKASDYVEQQEQDSDLVKTTSNIKTQVEDFPDKDILQPELQQGMGFNIYEPSLISVLRSKVEVPSSNVSMQRQQKSIAKEKPQCPELSNLTNLKNALTESVQMVTKNQMQQAFGPFMESLGHLFERKKAAFIDNATRMQSDKVSKLSKPHIKK